ncbi:MAG: ureidoglycolate lyase [Thermomicrobiales bacterium]
MVDESLRIVRLPVEPLTADDFAPFGRLLAAGDGSPDFVGVNSAGWRSGFRSDSPAEVMFYRSQAAGLRFTRLERHHHVTQSFVPLGNARSVIAVAAPTAADAAPGPEDVRAFLLDGSAGYVLNAGTWHALDRFPLSSAPVDVVIITDQATQQELESNPAGPWQRTEAIDYAERFGVAFEFEQ